MGRRRQADTESKMRNDPVFWEERQRRIEELTAKVSVEMAREDEARNTRVDPPKTCMICGKQFWNPKSKYKCWACRTYKREVPYQLPSRTPQLL